MFRSRSSIAAIRAGLHRLLALCLLGLPCIARAADYVGAQVCAQCHPGPYALWRESDHFRSMSRPDASAVKGDFTTQVSFHGLATRFSRKDGKFLVTTKTGEGQQTFPVAYAFGHWPLQQYLLAVGGGRLQALNLAWDARAPEEGGGRWFHLQPDEAITPSSPFFWTAHFQNWNSRCADCHSTAVTKSYDPGTGQYDTRYAEVNVACEACHGPGSAHAASGGKSPLAIARALRWQFKEGGAIASPAAPPPGAASQNAQINICGACHSRRSALAEWVPGIPYHDRHLLALLDSPLYHADGTIRDEVYVLGSFMQSRMHAAGVVCTNCHEPHSGRTLAEGSQVCAACHAPASYATPAHHRHPPGSAGADCLACHMPVRTYMQVDARRDHQFAIPHRGAVDAPSACHQCHSQALAFPDWTPAAPAFAQAQLALSRGDRTGHQKALAFIQKPAAPAIQRATLIAQLASAPLASLANWSREGSPLVRRAAGEVLARQGVGASSHARLLQSLLQDPVASVRHATARALVESGQPLPDLPATGEALKAYRQSLLFNADFPEAQTQLAALELVLGKPAAARARYQAALALEPAYVPALLNLADLERTTDEAAAFALLAAALAIAPESAPVHYAYALSLVRQQKTAEALPHLAKAAPASPQYAYAHALALDSQGQTPQALAALNKALAQWPESPALLSLAARYRRR